MSEDANQYQLPEGQSVLEYIQWLSLYSLGLSRWGRCYECEIPTAPGCWRSSRSSLWQTPGCPYGDSRAQAWQTSVGSSGTSWVSRRDTLYCNGLFVYFSNRPISLVVSPSVTVGQTAGPAEVSSLSVTQTNRGSPCWVNVHPVSKLLGHPVCSFSSRSGLSSRSPYRVNDKGCRSIWLLSFSAINLGV